MEEKKVQCMPDIVVSHNTQNFVLLFFSLGYLLIVCEAFFRLNKTAVALLTATAIWTTIFLGFQNGQEDARMSLLSVELFNTCQVLFFLLGALAIVEILHQYHAFHLITCFLERISPNLLPWGISLVTFFLSSVIDNLTTTIVVLSLVRALISDTTTKWIYGGIVVFAANAGGAWTPIGDVATTLLWINHKISTLGVIQSVFIPAFLSNVVTTTLLVRTLRNHEKQMAVSSILTRENSSLHTVPQGATLLLILGVALLISVPIISAVSGLPPFMVMLGNVGLLWCIIDLGHLFWSQKTLEEESKVLSAIQRVDYSVILFYFGLILSIHGLSAAGLFEKTAVILETTFSSSSIIALIIGLLSAIVDNVSLVASLIAVFSGHYIATYPIDSKLWLEVAYTAGVGGSILIIGSAAGVALMSCEKCTFMWYSKRIAPSAFIGYIIGWLSFSLL